MPPTFIAIDHQPTNGFHPSSFSCSCLFSASSASTDLVRLVGGEGGVLRGKCLASQASQSRIAALTSFGRSSVDR